MQYLAFQLCGMSAWGDTALSDFRPAHPAPSKSGVVGLVGACLGLPRFSPGLLALSAEYGFATRTDGEGAPFQDFQVMQVMPYAPDPKPCKEVKGACETHNGARFYEFRPGRGQRRPPGLTGCVIYQEAMILKLGRDNKLKNDTPNIVSWREYYMDSQAVVTLWPRVEAPSFSMEKIQEALQFPRYAPYLGRRCCVPTQPLHPQIVEAASAKEALQAYTIVSVGTPSRAPVSSIIRSEQWEEGCKWTEQRRDVLRTCAKLTEQEGRARRFSERSEHIL
jgi:CRISPR system Cascade subunit CasD